MMDRAVAFLTRVIPLTAALLLPALCGAAEVVLESEVTVSAQHDSNINLTEDNPVSLYGELVSTQANIEMRERNWSSYFDADLRFSDFNRPGYESDVQYLKFGGSREGERYELSLDASATHDTTRTSEGTDSGRFSNARRKQYSITPAWSYYLSARNLLTLQANASVTDYDDPRYVGYDYGSAYLEWTYIWNERLKYFVRANTTLYESNTSTGVYPFVGILQPFGVPVSASFEQSYTTKSTSADFQVGASYQWSEQLSLYGLFGNTDTDTEYEITTVGTSCDESNPEWQPGFRGLCDLSDTTSSTRNISANMVWKAERQTITLDYSFQNRPSSDGYLLESQRATVNWRYDISETGSILFDTVLGKNRALNEGESALRAERSNRDYTIATFTYRHKLTETWYINAYARYRYQEREIFSGPAESWGGRVGITYYPPTLQW